MCVNFESWQQMVFSCCTSKEIILDGRSEVERFGARDAEHHHVGKVRFYRLFWGFLLAKQTAVRKYRKHCLDDDAR